MVRLNAYWTSVERCFVNYSHLCGIVRISSPVQTILNKLIYGLDSFGPHFPRDISVAVARQSSSSPVQILAAAIVGPSPGLGFGFGFAFTFAFLPLPVFFLAPSMNA
jgi:hypothetical protein